MSAQEAKTETRLVTLYADCDGMVKTNYADDITFSWVAGDKISVLYHLKESPYTNQWVTFTASSTAASSAFTASVSSDLEIGAYSTGTKWAMYPASDNHTYTDDSKLGFSLESGYDGNTAKIPMIAKVASGSDDSFHFHQLCGAAKLTIKNIRSEVTRIGVCLDSNWGSDGQRLLSGVFNVQNPGSDTPSIVHNDVSASESRKMYAYADVNGSTHTATVFIPLPVFEIWASFVVNVYDAAGGTPLYSKHFSSGCIDIQRQKINKLSDLTLANIDSTPGIKIDGYISDWSTVSTQVSKNTNRIVDWKVTSDATNIYFLFKLVKSKVVASSRWSKYIVIGFDTAEGGTAADYGLEGDMEARAVIYPFDAPLPGFNAGYIVGTDSNCAFTRPVGTATDAKAIVGGNASDNDYVYVEISILRSALGSPSGTINVDCSYEYYNVGTTAVVLS